MNCNIVQPSISEMIAGTLPAAELWEIQAHLSVCDECRSVATEMEKLTTLLRTIPTPRLSPSFDSELQDRIGRLEQAHQNQHPIRRFTTSVPAWKFRLSAVMAAAILSVGLFLPTALHAPKPLSNAGQTDPKLVHQCVELHRSDVANQPLSDFAAQNLAQQLDQQAVPADTGDDDNS